MNANLFLKHLSNQQAIFPKFSGECTVADTIPVIEQSRNDAEDLLKQLLWKPDRFSATYIAGESGEAVVRFPSPLPQGDEVWDTAVMDWHVARDSQGKPPLAPAMLVLDVIT